MLCAPLPSLLRLLSTTSFFLVRASGPWALAVWRARGGAVGKRRRLWRGQWASGGADSGVAGVNEVVRKGGMAPRASGALK
ncbi:hypothetical protein ACP70R_022921 [Stipagrostis hirtigluma subsp. patula]